MAKAPGNAVRGSTTGRPVMVLFDILGQRWTLRILWELRNAPLSFRALRAACDNMSPTVLNRRLRDLRDLKLLQLTDDGFEMTEHGKSLGKQLAALDTWSKQWAQEISGEEASD